MDVTVIWQNEYQTAIMKISELLCNYFYLRMAINDNDKTLFWKQFINVIIFEVNTFFTYYIK